MPQADRPAVRPFGQPVGPALAGPRLAGRGALWVTRSGPGTLWAGTRSMALSGILNRTNGA